MGLSGGAGSQRWLPLRFSRAEMALAVLLATCVVTHSGISQPRMYDSFMQSRPKFACQTT